MTQKAKVLRIIYGADEVFAPGDIVDISSWNTQNVRAMVEDGRLLIINEESADTTELKAIIDNQKDEIAELKAKLIAHNLMFDPAIHLSEESKNSDGTYRRKPVKKTGDK